MVKGFKKGFNISTVHGHETSYHEIQQKIDLSFAEHQKCSRRWLDHVVATGTHTAAIVLQRWHESAKHVQKNSIKTHSACSHLLKQQPGWVHSTTRRSCFALEQLVSTCAHVTCEASIPLMACCIGASLVQALHIQTGNGGMLQFLRFSHKLHAEFLTCDSFLSVCSPSTCVCVLLHASTCVLLCECSLWSYVLYALLLWM